MFLIKIALLTVYVASFASSAHAKVPSEAVRAVYASYLAENRVLFYIGKHVQTDRVVIWGQTALSEDMVKIRLENNSFNMGPMEALLRSTGNRWSGNYKNYQLHDFFVSEPGQTDKIFRDAVRGSQELQLLDGYVDRVEELDEGERFFDVEGKTVLPVKKINGGVTECAVAAGSACSLLTESLKDFDKLVLTEIEKQILTYFAEHMEALQGNGIVIGEMADALKMSSGSLGKIRTRLKKKLDEGHFIQRIGSELRSGDRKRVYRFEDVDVLTTEEKEELILAYFAAHMEALEGNGIVIAEMAKVLDTSSGSLGKMITSLKKKLDEGHFIQRIGSEPRSGKYVYRFANDVEDRVVNYFAAHMEALEGNGIVVGEMAKALGIKSRSLGQKISILKTKLDKEHFIKRIGSELRSGDRKQVYRFEDVDVLTTEEKEELILAYFAAHMEALEGNGIVIAEMAKVLDTSSGSLGKMITSLKKKLDEGHFIQRIGGKPRSVDSKKVYRFEDVDVLTTEEKEELILAYFAAHMEELEGNGIVIAEMAEALGIKSGGSLGKIITSLKEKLGEEHFIQRIGSKSRRVDGKTISFYRFDDAVDVVVLTPAEEGVLGYFTKHMEALEGNGIVVGEMAKVLDISGRSLGKRITSLKKKLGEERFIQRIGGKPRSVDSKKVYRFADAVDVVVFTPAEERILAYFAAHMGALQGNGIVIGEMAEALDMSGGSLRNIIRNLKNKLDEEHFIQRIGSERRRVDGERINFYRFDDAVDVEQLQIDLRDGR